MKKIFISSVISSFTEERKVAKSAVESLNLQPVMAETFGAKPYSPKVACLEGVKESNVYLGMLGPRYGHIADSGLSVTEEEFNMARTMGIPILMFIMNCEVREPQQEKFVHEVSDYEEGYFVEFFDASVDLATKLTKSLYGFIIQSETKALDQAGAVEFAKKYIESLKPETKSNTSIGAIIFPSAQNTSYISILELGKKETKENLQQKALFGTGQIFTRELGVKTVEEREHLSFQQQHGNDESLTTIEFHPNGVLAWVSQIIPRLDDDFSFYFSFIIDQDQVQQKLTKFLEYASQYYGRLSKKCAISSFYLSTVIYSTENKRLGLIPSVAPKSMSMGFGSIEDPLVIPREPMRLAYTELKEPPGIANRLLQLIVRAFKASDQYYNHKS